MTRPLTPQLTCTNPFEWFEVHEDGTVFLCCPAWLKTKAGNLLKDDVATIWNSATAQAIRKRILDGSFGRCNKKRCPRLKLTQPPVRYLDHITDPEVAGAIRSRTTNLPFGPKRVNFCFDARCNLHCPSCRNTGLKYSLQQEENIKRIYENLIRGIAPSVEEITIAGHGDPFGAPRYRSFLLEFKREQFPKLKHIRLHSNGLLLNELLWRKLSHVTPLITEIEISIDAANQETYAQNRGGSWLTLNDNLAFIAQQNVQLTLSFVVQQNNYTEIPAFIEFAKTYGAKIYFSQLVNWGTFSKTEYFHRAVHLPAHPEHNHFLGILDLIEPEDSLDLGNLNNLLPDPSMKHEWLMTLTDISNASFNKETTEALKKRH